MKVNVEMGKLDLSSDLFDKKIVRRLDLKQGLGDDVRKTKSVQLNMSMDYVRIMHCRTKSTYENWQAQPVRQFESSVIDLALLMNFAHDQRYTRHKCQRRQSIS
jgi:hypothetical protein